MRNVQINNVNNPINVCITIIDCVSLMLIIMNINSLSSFCWKCLSDSLVLAFWLVLLLKNIHQTVMSDMFPAYILFV